MGKHAGAGVKGIGSDRDGLLYGGGLSSICHAAKNQLISGTAGEMKTDAMDTNGRNILAPFL